MKMGKVFLLDLGHGGIIDGVYQTYPKKMYSFESGEVAYEGVLNREIGKRVIHKLDAYGFKCINICPTEVDVPLGVRADVVNRYCEEYGTDECLLISLHSNSGKGTGFEIWTSPGQTKSDRYAELFYDTFKSMFPDVRLRSDTSDGDHDKESAFYILQETNCPAILPEFLFFDNWQDFQLLKSPVFQNRYADMILEFVKRAEITVV